MAIKKRINSCVMVAFFFAFIFDFSVSLRAQVQSIDSLRAIVNIKEDSLKQLDKIHMRLKKTFDTLNAEIFIQKKELESSNNPLLLLSLNSNLKESADIASKLEKLQNQKLQTRTELKKTYQRIILALDLLINQKLQVVRLRKNDRLQIELFDSIHQLETEKKNWQNKLNQYSETVVKNVPLEIEPEDTIERLNLKIQILKDRIAKTDGKTTILTRQRTELQSDSQIFEEMLNFMDNLQESIDPEQEYFDQERIDQLKNDLHNTTLKITGIDDNLIKLYDEKKELIDNLKKFENYLNSKLQN